MAALSSPLGPVTVCANPIPQLDLAGRQRLVYGPAPSHEVSLSVKTPKPLVAKIGACGRRIADAVKHRGNGGQQFRDSDQTTSQRTTM